MIKVTRKPGQVLCNWMIKLMQFRSSDYLSETDLAATRAAVIFYLADSSCE